MIDQAINTVLAAVRALVTGYGGVPSAGLDPASTAVGSRAVKDDWEERELLFLEALATDIAAVQAGAGGADAQVAQLTIDLGAMTGLRDGLVISLDDTLTAILAGIEADVLVVVAAMTDADALARMKVLEAAGANRANVIAALPA